MGCMHINGAGVVHKPLVGTCPQDLVDWYRSFGIVLEQ